MPLEEVPEGGGENLPEPQDGNAHRPVVVEGFGGVRMRRVCTGETIDTVLFAIGEDGELFSWGFGRFGMLGHGDEEDQPSPTRVEALRGIRVSAISVGWNHALALTEYGLVYAWGTNKDGATLGNPDIERELLPSPVETLHGVRAVSIAVGEHRNYVLDDTGVLWAWGIDGEGFAPLGHGERVDCPLPKEVEALRGVKVDAIGAGKHHTLALADDGSVYAWGSIHTYVNEYCSIQTHGGKLGRVPSVAFTPRLPVSNERCEGETPASNHLLL
jgi:alpha-tubulin suppressor-like RCC1 family protein